jgi:hypothetical protein
VRRNKQLKVGDEVKHYDSACNITFVYEVTKVKPNGAYDCVLVDTIRHPKKEQE